MDNMKPKAIVAELDKHIIGQSDAKKSVAIALRNRWRRQHVDPSLRQEITPKNILMIGPTGVGKTEIARRLARLVRAPFIKIEATKFTEVGYVGRDVDSIIRDLMDVALKQAREEAIEKQRAQAESAAEDRILDALLPPARTYAMVDDTPAAESETRQKFRKKLQNGELDDKEIDIQVQAPSPHIEMFAPAGMEEMSQQLSSILNSMSHNGRKQTRKLKIAEARKILLDEEAERLVNEDDVRQSAIDNVEQNGIVFIDEIDKVTSRNAEGQSGEISRAGVQRDLLPLVEGTTVNTKYGMIKTDHILFIASGAFHLSKPSDLIPELQGRFPIRVELKSLSVEDFEHILTRTDACLTQQYQALLQTEGIALQFTDEGVRSLAEIAWDVNEKTENIGARRLHTVLEKLLEEVSFESEAGEVKIDADFVRERLAHLAKKEDLARYVL